jgi:hypothetical protein|nr:MAG TPA: hypothetical protein [Caudoviricetes sp.]
MMSATVGLIAEMLRALKECNAGMVSASGGEYHIIVCTDEAYNVLNEAYDEWAAGEEIE